MTRRPEGVHVRSTDDGFVQVQVVKYSLDIDVGETLCIDASSAAEFISIARRIHQDEGPYQTETLLGANALRFLLGGPEHEPILIVMNKRPDDAARPGLSGVSLAWGQVEDALTQVERLAVAR